MNTKKLKYIRKARRKKSIKLKITGTPERPRLSVYKSLTNIYAQLIDDVNGLTLASASTIDTEVKSKLKDDMSKLDASKLVGEVLAERAKDKKLTDVAFDRNGNIYTGRIKALADGAREAGLNF